MSVLGVVGAELGRLDSNQGSRDQNPLPYHLATPQRARLPGRTSIPSRSNQGLRLARYDRGMSALLLVAASFLASGVEAVEALTIVLAVGVVRGWRSPLYGTAVALAALTAIVAVLGPALTAIPISALRVVVGGLLLVFGLQWLRKAILRASGHKALHDEEAIFREQAEQARALGAVAGAGIDWYAFTIAFKGVLLEGLEVAFIVVTFGSNQGSIPLAAAGAAAAIVVVVAAGVAVRAPLSRVPENTLKFSVGLLLTTFGTFWGAEGAGADWPGSDLAILGLLVFYLGVSRVLVLMLRRTGAPVPAPLGAE
jgi:uncharacterized membrane protein